MAEIVVERTTREQCTVVVPDDATEEDILAEAARNTDWFTVDTRCGDMRIVEHMSQHRYFSRR